MPKHTNVSAEIVGQTTRDDLGLSSPIYEIKCECGMHLDMTSNGITDDTRFRHLEHRVSLLEETNASN